MFFLESNYGGWVDGRCFGHVRIGIFRVRFGHVCEIPTLDFDNFCFPHSMVISFQKIMLVSPAMRSIRRSGAAKVASGDHF